MIDKISLKRLYRISIIRISCYNDSWCPSIFQTSPVKTKGPAPDVPLWAPPPDDPVSAWLNRSSSSSRNDQVDKVVTGGNTLDDFINAFQVPLADERPAQPLPGAVGRPMTSSAGTSTRTSSSSSRSITPSVQVNHPPCVDVNCNALYNDLYRSYSLWR